MRPTSRFSFLFVSVVFDLAISFDAVDCIDQILSSKEEKELCDDLKLGTRIRQRCAKTCGKCTEGDECIDDSRCASWFQAGNCTSAVLPIDKQRPCSEILNKMTHSRGKRKREHSDSDMRPRKKSKHHYERPNSVSEHPYEFFKESLNDFVRPCDDFYKFTCDKYTQRHPPGASNEEFDVYADLQKEVDKQQKEAVLNRNYQSNSKAVNKVLLFRDKCLNVESIEQNSTSLWQSMQAIGQGVPMFSAAFDPNGFDLEDTLIKMADESGMRGMYKLKTHKPKDKQIHLMIEAASPIMLPDFYDTHDVQKRARSLLFFLYRIMGLIWKDQNLRLPTPNIEIQLREVIDHDYALAMKLLRNKIGRSVENGGPAIEEKRMADLKGVVSMIDWNRYLTHDLLLSDEVKAHFMDNPPVFMHSEQLLKEVDALHKAVDKRVLANYLFVRFVVNSLPFLDIRFSQTTERFFHEVHGPTYTSKREDLCYDLILSVLPLVANHIYLKKQVKPETFRAVERMSEHMRSGMKSMFHEANWMTKTAALEKLKNLRMTIGAMEDVEDEEKLDKRYEEVHLAASDSLLQMNRKLQRFYERRQLGHIVHLHWRTLSESERIYAVNSNYFFKLNTVVMSAAMLQPPFLDLDQPAAVSYGGIGFIIGHEMTHGFAGNGLHFDENREPRYWLDSKTEREFKRRCDRLIKVYNKQVERTINVSVNGTNTLNENIADFGGIRAAFKAYKQQLDGKHERHVSGYGKYTNEQTFFIAYGTLQCTSYPQKTTEQDLATGKHALSRFRVNVVLANLREFAEAFECKEGTKMNPKKRVLFW